MADVVTIDQLRELVKADKVKPSDIFGADMLTEDPVVKGIVDSETKRATAGEYAHRKRTEEGFDKTRAELEKKLQERDTAVQQLKLEAAKGKVGAIFDKAKGERKLSERQVKFVKARLDRFSPKEIDKLDDEFKSFLDGEIDEEAKLAKLYGIDGADGKDKDAGGKQDQLTGPDKTQPAPDAKSKYIDPKTNPFIRI